MKEIYLAGGCFWGVEKYLKKIPGVTLTEAGYANGKTENPSYEDVKYHESGHAETVRVQYDPKEITLDFLLALFFKVIDPTSLNRQGEDEGIQYRTGIYYTDGNDKEIIENSLEKLSQSIDGPIVVEVLPLENYYTAEQYHQNYLDKNPTGYCHVGPDKFEILAQALREKNNGYK